MTKRYAREEALCPDHSVCALCVCFSQTVTLSLQVDDEDDLDAKDQTDDDDDEEDEEDEDQRDKKERDRNLQSCQQARKDFAKTHLRNGREGLIY